MAKETYQFPMHKIPRVRCILHTGGVCAIKQYEVFLFKDRLEGGFALRF